MKKQQTRREFLKAGALTGSLLVLPGGLSGLSGKRNEELSTALNAEDPAVSWFATGGETIYHLKTGKTSSQVVRSVFAAAFSGKILCYDLAGNKLWEQNAGNFFPFDMDAGDIDGDGFDECAVASADGSLYIFDHDGTLVKKVFTGKPPLYAVKIVTDNSGNHAVYCGGPERILYKVSPDGSVLNQAATSQAITNIASGNFTVTSGKGLLVGTQGNYAKNYISFFSLENLIIIGSAINTNSTYLYRMTAADIDSDPSDRIVFGGNKLGSVFNSSGAKLYDFPEKNTGRGQDVYTMLFVDSIPQGTGNERQMIGLCGNTLRFFKPDGTIQKEVAFDIAPAAMHYDDSSGVLFFGSEISGGDTVYLVRMSVTGWENELKSLGYKGKISQIVTNINTLTSQVNAFERPAYQPVVNVKQTNVFGYNPFNPGTLSEINPDTNFVPLANLYNNEFPYSNLHFSGNQWLSENWDRSALLYGWDTKRDKRMTYKFTSQEIINYAKTLEQRNLSFTWTIGHGNDPFFLSLATVEGILVAAPNACKGFIFPEMEAGDTQAFRYAVETHFKPICDLCLKYGKRKIFLRSKFMFWSADIYTSLWNWMLKDKKYKDVIVPSMEETYERLCDQSLAGRVGLKQGGWFTDWAGRAVHDNACYDRQHQWAATTIGSHFLRALCYQAELGARYNLIQLGEATSTGFRGHSFIVKPYLHMLGKGILRCPQNTADMLSLSPVALGMRSASTTFIEASHNSHQIAIYSNDPKWVFSRLQCFWGQAPTPEHDFGYYTCGRRKQALNYLPVTPYGLVPVHPDDGSSLQAQGVTKVISTDGEYWYDESGNQHTAEDWADNVEDTLKTAAATMFAAVTGDVAWTATKIDPTHTRMVLIDPGYLDPDDREATVKFNIPVTYVRDILGKLNLTVTDNTVTLTVPMGIIRVIDIEHSPLADVETPLEYNKVTVFPNPFSDHLEISLSQEDPEMDIEILDLNGQIIMKDSNKTVLNTQHFAKGLYMIAIMTRGERHVQKIIKV